VRQLRAETIFSIWIESRHNGIADALLCDPRCYAVREKLPKRLAFDLLRERSWIG